MLVFMEYHICRYLNTLLVVNPKYSNLSEKHVGVFVNTLSDPFMTVGTFSGLQHLQAYQRIIAFHLLCHTRKSHSQLCIMAQKSYGFVSGSRIRRPFIAQYGANYVQVNCLLRKILCQKIPSHDWITGT